MNKDLEELIRLSRAYWGSLSPNEREKVIQKQIEGVVRAEISWPEPKFTMVDGVKVYESYEDYCNG